ncbi:MAG: TolC family protein [Desulfobacca sp.]|uniref:TolC family protein n=1 Tax=Desulfobacca sp. TaxID=2067990 RepID=UPI0040492F04
MSRLPCRALSALLAGGFFWCSLTVWGAAPPQAALSGPSDLQIYIGEALQANPEIKRLAAQRKASREAIGPAGALDDPMLTLGFFNLPVNTFSFRQEDMTQKTVGMSQKFPFPGKRRLRSEAAAEQAKADAFALLDKLNEIRSRVIQAYWGLSLANGAAAITEKNKQFWEQVVQVAETRYATGQGLQADVLQAQVELGNYLDRLLQWQQQAASRQAELNALRDQPVATPLPPPAPLRPRVATPALAEMLALLESRPQIKALRAQIQKQEKAVALARKDYWPDVNIGVNYSFRENSAMGKRPDFFTSYVQISLPLWFRSKQAPRLREEEAKQVAAENAYQAALNELAAAVKDRTDRLARLAQQIRLYEQGIIPQAQQAALAALAAYQVGSLDFTRLVQTTLVSYEVELKYQEYLRDFEENWATLEILVGQEIPRQPGEK